MEETGDVSGFVHQRYLEENNDEVPKTPTSQVVEDTFLVYGSIFAILFLIFLIVRPRYPRAYNVRNTVPELNCELAKDTLGSLRWIYRVFFIPEDEMLQNCGLDTVIYLRFMRYGFLVALMGILNSIYLMPIYGTSPTDPTASLDIDGLDKISLGNVPENDNRVYATVIAAYIFFGYAMFLLLKEFNWFTKYRHEFLSRAQPDNYTVFVDGIPPEYRTDESLLAYFHEVYPDDVSEARVALNLSKLEGHVAKRAKIVTKLEHAINVLNATGQRPTHIANKSSRCGKSEEVDSIETYTEQLREYNEQISRMITVVEESANGPTGNQVASSSNIAPENRSVESVSVNSNIEDGDKKMPATSEGGEEKKGTIASLSNVPLNISTGITEGLTAVTHATKTLIGSEEGTPKGAAFVTFASLRARASALQMLHHEKPFAMTIREAPLPKDIFWPNVGLPHTKQQLSWLAGFSLTTVLCIFWAVVVTFIASLASVETLKQEIPFLRRWIESVPFLQDLFAQLAPLLLVIANGPILSFLLMKFSAMEGWISVGKLNISLFTKLCIFNIVHTFFILVISGSIFGSIGAIVNNPSLIVNELATTIPSEASFFMQYFLVRSFLNCGMELLRVFHVLHAYIRTKVGPNLTEKEKNTTWGWFAPLSDPGTFGHAGALADLLLVFLVLFVYGVISPFMSFILLLVFAIHGMVHRHHFIYIYPMSNDSGGLLWVQAVKVIIICLFIAEITLFGVLGLKKKAAAVILMIPLLAITILFTIYIGQQHFVVTKYLPSISAIKKDKENIANNVDNGFLRGQYNHPALQDKHLLPDNMPNDEPHQSFDDNA